jgi:hypothetical protein
MFLVSQKNQLYAAIKEHGLSLRDFRLDDSTELRLTHVPSGFYYRIYISEVLVASNDKEQRLESLFTPNFRALIVTPSEARFPSAKKWPDLIGFLQLWLNWLREETTQPDLWAEMEQGPDFFAEQETLPEDAFTPAEIKLLEARVEHIEQQLSELDLPAETEEAIAQAVREVPEKSKRLTKKEMGEILLSSVLRESFKAALSKDTMLAVWHLLMNLFTLAIGQ